MLIMRMTATVLLFHQSDFSGSTKTAQNSDFKYFSVCVLKLQNKILP